jgi:hypothetical protein
MSNLNEIQTNQSSSNLDEAVLNVIENVPLITE